MKSVSEVTPQLFGEQISEGELHFFCLSFHTQAVDFEASVTLCNKIATEGFIKTQIDALNQYQNSTAKMTFLLTKLIICIFFYLVSFSLINTVTIELRLLCINNVHLDKNNSTQNINTFPVFHNLSIVVDY